MQEIRVIAKAKGIKSAKMTKLKLVQAIQEDEGNNACFGSDKDQTCDQLDCLWKDDCYTTAKKVA